MRRTLAAALLVITVNATFVPPLPALAAQNTAFAAVADTYVDKSEPRESFGSARRLIADSSPSRRVFLKFDVTGLTGAVTQARLRLRLASSNKHGGTVRAATNSWAENVTWASQPTVDGVALGKMSLARRGEWAEADLRQLVTGNGTFSIAITAESGDALVFDAREAGANGPQLHVVTETFSDDPVVLAAGDVSSCWTTGDTETAGLIDTIPGTVALLGDGVYPTGSWLSFQDCYEPTWGRHKARTRPVAGNHEYKEPDAAGYYDYFGAAAGDRDKGYYSYDLGAWHVVVLNSNCEFVACVAGSPQEQWLRADLASNPRLCTLAMWHHPLFTSGLNHKPTPETLPLFQALYDFGVEAVLGGHNHQYERFAPQDPAGMLDVTSGIRQFVAGMGGSNHYAFTRVAANSEIRNNDTFGVLKLTLRPARYDWEFVPVPGKTFTDIGSTACH